MASDGAQQPAGTRRPRLRRALAIAVGVAALLLLIGLAFCGWLLGTESGARTALSYGERFSGGMLRAQGVEGRLIGPLRIARLVLEQPDRRLTLTDLRLDWRPPALLQQKLHLTSVHIGHLGIAGKIDQKQEPAKLPEQIGLPFALQADQVSVDGGEISRGPVSLVKLGPFALGLDYDGNLYRLRLHEFAAGSALAKGSVATRFSGQATLSVQKPYALEGSFSSRSNATMDEREIGAAGQVRLAGSLAELSASLDFTVNRAPIQGHALLRPFSENPLGPARLSAQALDLSALDVKLPRTALDIDFSSADDGGGELTLRNAAAGPYNEQKLPLSSLLVRFRQHAGQLHFDRILARPGTRQQPAGDIAGSGRYADSALTLALRTDALNLQRIDSRMRATRLAGEVALRHAGGKQEFTIALSEPLPRLPRQQQQRIALTAHGVLADAELTLDRAELQAGSGRIEASAHVALAGRQGFRAQGKISRFRLEELGAFPQAPPLLLNGEFTLRGTRQPQLEADLAFRITDSSLAGQPLVGDGEAQLRGERLQVPRFLLASGANRLHLQGQLAQGDAQLAFALEAPQLAQLGTRFGGALQASGVASGTVAQPHIKAEWSASNARIAGDLQIESMQGKADIDLDRKRPFILNSAVANMSARGVRIGSEQVKALSAQLRFAPQPDAPLALALRAEGIATSRLRADSFTANVQGVTARHTIDAALIEPGVPGQNWALHASGGLSQLGADARWQGSIERFDANGRFAARLASRAALLLSAQRVQLDDFLLDAGGGRIAVQRFVRDAAGISTRGRVERLQLAELLRHMTAPPPVKTDLQVGGEWDVRIADTLSGAISMRRESGDMTVLGAAPLTLGLRTLNAGVTANAGRLVLQLHADGAQLGRIDVDAATTAGNGASRLSIASDAPVSGSARIDVPSLRWVAPLVSPSMQADGRLQSDVTLGGTFGAPRFAGRIAGDALRLTWNELGLELRQGTLQSEFDGERLLIRRLDFQGGEGRVALSGPIDFGGGAIAAQLTLVAERFALLNRSDRRLVLSGESRIDMKEHRASIRGAFTANAGYFDIGSAGKPQLSDDVVVVGRKEKTAAKTVADIDIAIALGDGVTLKGRGLDALLVGQGRLLGKAGEALRAQGTLSIANGTYTAYGRELAIEQGLLRFGGPLNNPALDILAMRRGQEVEAGVSVRGTVLQPRVSLVSEPVVPDSEKLSWLVLGRGLASAGEGDMGALQAAAAALLSKSAQAGVESRIASAFGLDAFSVGTSQDSLQQRIVTLGKQISSKLYVSYQQGLESAGSVIQLRYILSPKLSVEAEAGTRSAVSLFYNIAFD